MSIESHSKLTGRPEGCFRFLFFFFFFSSSSSSSSIKPRLLLSDLSAGLFTVCLGVFALPLGVIGRLCSVIVLLPGYLLHYYFYLFCLSKGFLLRIQYCQEMYILHQDYRVL